MNVWAAFSIKSVVLAAVLFFSTHAFAANDDHIWLRVEGKHIVTSPLADPPNRIFLPMGTMVRLQNTGGRFEHAAKFIKKSSLNTARLSFKTTSWWTTDSYNFDATLATILKWLEIAREHRIYTVLDHHEYLGHNNSCYTLANDPDKVFELWKTNYSRLAEAVKDNPWVIGFELMNEVFTRTMTREQVDAALRDCALRIREVNTNHILFVNHHSIDDPAYFDALDPPQVAISPHIYPPSPGSWYETVPYSWDEARTAGNYPVLCTEFGGGLGGNGFTYSLNKNWMAGFMRAVDSLKIGWMVLYINPDFHYDKAAPDRDDPGYFFPTTYGPDDPEIWRPTAISMSEQFPIPSNGIPVRIEFDSIPEWFSSFVATEDEVTLTMRIVDTTGSMVTSSNAALSVNVTGPATLANVPTAFANGKASVTLRSTGTPGAINVTATSGSLSGAYPITSVKTWTNLQVQTLDSSWADSGAAFDNYSPACRIDIRHPSKGINLKTARYEYSTDGGESWVYWDDEESDEFEGTSLNSNKWTMVNNNTAGGSAAVSGGALTINAEGEDIWSTWRNNWTVDNIYAKDEFTYVYEERTGEFEIVTKITSQDNTSPTALAGIMVRDNMEDTQFKGYCYVAATPDSGYVFAWKDLGRTLANGADKSTFKYIDAREFAGNVTYPCYLKLTKVKHPCYYHATPTAYNRRFHIYTAWYSTDGVNWTKIKSRYVTEASTTQLVGLFAASGVSGTYGNAVFDFYRSGLYAQHTDPEVVSGFGEIVYSSGAERFQTKPISFVNSSKRQEVRFRINTVVPFTDFMNNPGEELVSPRYSIFDGEHTAALPSEVSMQPAALRAVSGHGGIKVNYRLAHGSGTVVRFAAYNLAGKKVWSKVLHAVGTDGSVLLERGIPAGMYIVRMNTSATKSGKTMSMQTTVIHAEK